jgi:protein-tyrosine phosphatase
MTFNILTVCTGNICRSPQTAQLLRAGFLKAKEAGFDGHIPEITSAGTHAMIGHQMPPLAAELSLLYGGDPTGHLARALTVELIDEADLILGLAREHRSAVAKLAPRASRKTFTLREFSRTIGSSSGIRQLSDFEPSKGDYEGWVKHAAMRRGMSPGTPKIDDVVDPFGRDHAMYTRSVEQIVPAVRTITSSFA